MLQSIFLPQNKPEAIHTFTRGRKRYSDELAYESEFLADSKEYWSSEYYIHLFLHGRRQNFNCDVWRRLIGQSQLRNLRWETADRNHPRKPSGTYVRAYKMLLRESTPTLKVYSSL